MRHFRCWFIIDPEFSVPRLRRFRPGLFNPPTALFWHRRAYLRRARRSLSDGARRRGVGSEAGGGGGGGHGCDNDGVRARPRLAHLVRQLPLGRVVAHRAAVRLGHSWLRAARALSGGMAAEPLQPAILRTAATADAASAPPARAGWCGPLLSRPRVAGCGPLSKAKARQRFGQGGAAQASPLPEHASGRPKLPPAAAAPLLVLRRPVLRRGWRPGRHVRTPSYSNHAAALEDQLRNRAARAGSLHGPSPPPHGSSNDPLEQPRG